MYKLLVSDFDGTLLDSDEAIPLTTMVEIDRIRKDGCLIAISTGRVLKSVMDYNRDFPFIDYVISCNGAYVYDVNNKKVIYKKSVLASVIKKLKKLYGEYDINFCDTKYWYFLHGNNKERPLEERERRIKDFDSFYEKNKSSIYKVEILFDDKKTCDRVYDEILELNLKITINKFIYNDYMYGVEITHKDVDKLIGIEKICNKNKISLDEVIGIGDSDNDISTIKNVGMGVCVSNASKEVKKIAKMKTSSNDTKGVEKVIKKFL
ncbi:MAG: HAD family phosphatase [Bacilli bacterium]|nr:HAD family phosphatase [Bacilli bacterium]